MTTQRPDHISESCGLVAAWSTSEVHHEYTLNVLHLYYTILDRDALLHYTQSACLSPPSIAFLPGMGKA
jgi:hypothetical protein